LGIFESPIIGVIENNHIYYYNGIFKNIDVLRDFIKHYKEKGRKYEIPLTPSFFKNAVKYLKSKFEMFEILYDLNKYQFFAYISFTIFNLIGMFWAWRLLNDHIENLKKKTQ